MKTIVYENRCGVFECVKATNGNGSKIKIIFEEPIDGKIMIGDSVFSLARGVSEIDTVKLCDGKISPKLYSGGKFKSLEAFTLNNGVIGQVLPDAEYIRSLSKAVAGLSERISVLEAQNAEITDKITQKLKF